MTVSESMRLLRLRWPVLAAVTAAAVVLAALGWLLRPVEYTSELTLYAAVPADSAQAAYQGAQLAQQRVTSYVELADGPRVGAEVAARLGTGVAGEEISERTAVTTPMESVLVQVAVTGPTAEEAALVADTVGAVVIDLVAELEAPAALAGTGPVTLQVAQPATVPATPSSPGLGLTLAVGLLAGLAAGAVALVLLGSADTSVGSGRRLAELTAAPTLAVVDGPTGFARLRATLDLLDPADPPRALLVTSALPGEGRTATVLGLAGARAAAGGRVLVVDADLRDPALARRAGVADDGPGLADVLAGRVEPRRAVRTAPGGFDVLPAGPPPADPAALLAVLPLRALLGRLRMHYDTILLDSPALLPVTDGMILAAAADGVLLVCRDRTPAAAVTEAVDLVDAATARLLGGVLTAGPARPGRGPVARRRPGAAPAAADPGPPTAPALAPAPWRDVEWGR